ncbi:dienelactone hydrolase family protein [Planctomicrobium sp. SH527]|uniref:carboxylesterase family protein n=1 Tax=Planctomicrobium sp. SH527 TaxID=3448123 RepID=UPI003F5C9F6A
MRKSTSLATALLLTSACLLTVTMSSNAVANDVAELFAVKQFTGANSEVLNYRELTPPKITPDTLYPLVVFLHGAGERGDDNTAQLVHVAKELATPEMRERHPAFVFAPQCPKMQRWVETDWTLNEHSMPEVASTSMGLLISLIEESVKKLPIDPKRIYIVGLSMGGYGTWDLMQRRPDLVAAGIPICGGGDATRGEVLKNIPIWAFHGDQDQAVKVERSRAMIKAIKEAKGHPIYTEYPGVGHNSWTMTAQNRLVWDWLFAQHK